MDRGTVGRHLLELPGQRVRRRRRLPGQHRPRHHLGDHRRVGELFVGQRTDTVLVQVQCTDAHRADQQREPERGHDPIAQRTVAEPGPAVAARTGEIRDQHRRARPERLHARALAQRVLDVFHRLRDGVGYTDAAQRVLARHQDHAGSGHRDDAGRRGTQRPGRIDFAGRQRRDHSCGSNRIRLWHWDRRTFPRGDNASRCRRQRGPGLRPHRRQGPYRNRATIVTDTGRDRPAHEGGMPEGLASQG